MNPVQMGWSEIQGANRSQPSFHCRNIPKSEDEVESLYRILQTNCLFHHLAPAELHAILMAMEKMQFKKGEFIMTQGGPGENFYVVGDGQVGVVINDERVSKIRSGGTFGELELMYDSPCAASMVAESEQVVVWAIDRPTYKLMVMLDSISKRREYEDVLLRVPVFKELTASERSTLADALCPAVYKDGELLLQYGEEGEWMHIVVEGTVEVIGSISATEKVKVCEFRAGCHFGHLEFVNNHTNVVDVIAKGPVKTVKLNRYHIELCMTTLKELVKENMHNPVYDYYREKMLARTIRYIGRAGRRRAPVVSESYEQQDETFVPTEVPKSPQEAEMLAQQLIKTHLFSAMTPEDIQSAVKVMARRTTPADTTVARQGEAETCFFVIESGTCSMEIDGSDPSETLEVGGAFGDMELMYNTPCTATVRAETQCMQWTIDRPTYRHIIMKIQLQQRQKVWGLCAGDGVSIHGPGPGPASSFRRQPPGYVCMICTGYNHRCCTPGRIQRTTPRTICHWVLSIKCSHC